jgi:hypothetical protein
MEDGNVVHLPLGVLTAAAAKPELKVQPITGDPVRCTSCEAVLNANSKLDQRVGAIGSSAAAHEFTWRCEFCGTSNDVVLEQGERPTQRVTEYLLAPPPQHILPESEPITVFCIDCSGSMCVSQEVRGKIALHALGQRRAQQMAAGNSSLAAFGDGSQQWLPSQRNRSDVSYVSRLECVQAAVHQQIDALPANRRVALVAFNGDVTAHLGGVAEPMVLTGDLLNDLDGLIERGAQAAKQEAQGSDSLKKQAREKLLDRVYALQEGGPTALGPALAFAMGLALKRSAGSHIIVCTDGRANVGVGSLSARSVSRCQRCGTERPRSPSAPFLSLSGSERSQAADRKR